MPLEWFESKTIGSSEGGGGGIKVMWREGGGFKLLDKQVDSFNFVPKGSVLLL